MQKLTSRSESMCRFPSSGTRRRSSSLGQSRLSATSICSARSPRARASPAIMRATSRKRFSRNQPSRSALSTRQSATAVDADTSAVSFGISVIGSSSARIARSVIVRLLDGRGLRWMFVAASDESATRIPSLVRFATGRCQRSRARSWRTPASRGWPTPLPGAGAFDEVNCLCPAAPGVTTEPLRPVWCLIEWVAGRSPAARNHPHLSGSRMMVSVLRSAVALRAVSAFLGFVLPGIAAAQGSATLTGRIVDTAGAPIPGASLRVPQLERSVAVDSTGHFRLDSLPTGRLTVVGEAPGFAGKRADVTVPASGTIEQAFSLVPNAHVLANVEVRARARKQLPLRLHEFEQRRNRAAGGRFLGPDEVARFDGRPLMDALKSVMVGVRFQRNVQGEMNIVSQRSLNPASIRQSSNIKPCGIQIWQDGALLSDPNQSIEITLPQPSNASRSVSTQRIGADHDYDISNLLANDYMAVEYYSDLASTPPGFRTGTPSCGTLVLWTRMPLLPSESQAGEPSSSPPTPQ